MPSGTSLLTLVLIFFKMGFMLTKSDLQKIRGVINEAIVTKEEAKNLSIKNEVDDFSETINQCKDEIVDEIRELRVYIVTNFFKKAGTSS